MSNKRKMPEREEISPDSVLWEDWLQKQITRAKELVMESNDTILQFEREKKRILREIEDNRKRHEQAKIVITIAEFKRVCGGETLICDIGSLFCNIYGECLKFYSDETTSYYVDGVAREHCKNYFGLCDAMQADSIERSEYGKFIAKCLKVETITLKREVIGTKCTRDGKPHTVFNYVRETNGISLENHLKKYNNISDEAKFSKCIEWKTLFPVIVDPRNVIITQPSAHRPDLVKGYVSANMITFGFWNKCRIN